MYAILNPENILEKKPILFLLVVLIVIVTLAVPIIIPHLLHGAHLVHIGLHIGGISIAIFLTILAYRAYFRLQTKRLLLTSFAFGIFVTAETLLLVDATWPTIYDISYFSLKEMSHVLMIITLSLLALGVFRND